MAVRFLGGGLFLPLRLQRTDRRAGQVVNFEGADETLAVGHCDAVGGGGVDRGEPGVEFGVGEFGEAGAEGFVLAGAVEEAFDQGFEVEVGAADDDRGPTVGEAGFDKRVDVVQPVVDGETLVRFDDVDGFVADAVTQRAGGFGGAGVQVPVDLHGVGPDDEAAPTLGQGRGEVGLAARGGAENDGGPRGDWGGV